MNECAPLRRDARPGPALFQGGDQSALARIHARIERGLPAERIQPARLSGGPLAGARRALTFIVKREGA